MTSACSILNDDHPCKLVQKGALSVGLPQVLISILLESVCYGRLVDWNAILVAIANPRALMKKSYAMAKDWGRLPVQQSGLDWSWLPTTALTRIETQNIDTSIMESRIPSNQTNPICW